MMYEKTDDEAGCVGLDIIRDAALFFRKFNTIQHRNDTNVKRGEQTQDIHLGDAP